MKRFALLMLAPLAGCVAVAARMNDAPREIERAYAATPFASSIVIPPGYDTIRLPGMVADPAQPAADGRPAVFGDTEAQVENVLAKIKAALATLGAGEGDVVAMTVYLAAPSPRAPMDFAGMGRAYARHYGTPAQPQRPVRSTVQVAALAAPGALVEIEVTAARKPR
jgi:enamine deaminase RidA (YjgF/YER057c/UK114 family)